MLKLDRVSKFYSQNGVVTAGFSQVSLNFEMGEFVAITGESGSGKSTLLNVISGLDSYEEGEMYIFGQPTSGYGASDLEEYRKRYIGNIFQTFNLINHYTVYQNVEMVLLLSGYDDAEIPSRVDLIIDRVGLTAYRNTKASKLSGGQKQRVAIARALAKETPIIVADEPTGNLDVASAADIIKLLASISKEKLIIIVTHNYEQVEPYVTRKISMHDGRIAEDKRIAGLGAAATQANDSNIDSARIEQAAAQAATKATAQAAAAPHIREAVHDALTKKNTLRLGARNAFSLPAKFLLLLFVFLVLTAGVFASYSAYIGMRDGLNNNVWGWVFENVSPNRVVVTKPDWREFSDADIKEIEDLENISYVVTHDILMDSGFSMSDDDSLSNYMNYDYYDEEYEYKEVDYWLSVVIRGMDTLSEGELVAGRLPETKNEAVLMLCKTSWFAENKADGILDETGYLEPYNVMFPADGMNAPVDIVGIAYFYEDPDINGVYWEANLLMTEEGLSAMERLCMQYGSLIEAKAGDRVLSVGTSYYDDIWFIADETVARGTVVVPDFIYNMASESEGTVSIGLSGGNAVSKMSIRVRKSSFDRTKEFTIATTQNEDNRVHIHPDDLWSLYEAPPVKQVSAILESTLYQAETRAEIEELGYKTLYLNQTAERGNQLEKVLTSALRIIVLIFLLAVLFFVIYFITKLIMKSQNVYYSTVRMLGGSKKACSGTLLSELLVVFHITFFICLAVMIKITIWGSNILPAYAVRLIRYINPIDYVVLYIIVLAMTLLLAYRYSSQMFRKTAMNAYREEV
ncbi:MAG: ABC transporter ATP-binding protein [Firmicutes bacterium]|nr:ABC transporter ATP-binding protein [Bacillota bacterium]